VINVIHFSSILLFFSIYYGPYSSWKFLIFSALINWCIDYGFQINFVNIIIHFVVLPLTVQSTPVQPLEQVQIPGEVHIPPLKQPWGQYAERTMIITLICCINRMVLTYTIWRWPCITSAASRCLLILSYSTRWVTLIWSR